MSCDLRSEQKQINGADFEIDPRLFTGCVDMTAMAGETNAVRLETAFRVAETELGVARLLDPEVRKTCYHGLQNQSKLHKDKTRLRDRISWLSLANSHN